MTSWSDPESGFVTVVKDFHVWNTSIFDWNYFLLTSSLTPFWPHLNPFVSVPRGDLSKTPWGEITIVVQVVYGIKVEWNATKKPPRWFLKNATNFCRFFTREITGVDPARALGQEAFNAGRCWIPLGVG